MREAFATLGLDPAKETPGRLVVRHLGESLVEAMEMALSEAPEQAQLVAAECVVGGDEGPPELGADRRGRGEARRARRRGAAEAHEQVEEQEDEHLYHTMGWSRELWFESLGMPAVLPPPEEEKNVKTAIGAARAKNARDEML